MINTKIRTLLHKNVKFCWTKDHQADFDQVIATLSNLDFPEPYKLDSEIFALVYASQTRLVFVLLQKDSNRRSSILQAGSTA